MIPRSILSVIILTVWTSFVAGGHLADEEFSPSIRRPVYPTGQGPRVFIDEAHCNFHTISGSYKPFANLLRKDGYQVNPICRQLSETSLQSVDILVISNAINERDVNDWSLPIASAFTEDEISSLYTWVENGGALFLITDHMPWPGAVDHLAKAFGIQFSNGYAASAQNAYGEQTSEVFMPKNGLKDNTITNGRGTEEAVTKVVSFVGSAFKPPQNAMPILVYGTGAVSLETERAWELNDKTPRRSIEGWCQLAVIKVGRGRVAVSGEAAMFSAQLYGPEKTPMGMNSPEAKQNVKLLLNLIHWLSRVPGMEGEQNIAPPVQIQTPEIIRILEEENIASLRTAHSQSISITLRDGRRYMGKYDQSQAGQKYGDDHLWDILNLVSHIRANRRPEEVRDWSITCE